MQLKKSLGQHLLTDESVCSRIADRLQLFRTDWNTNFPDQPLSLLEIGPGQGVLTAHLLPLGFNFKAIDLDERMVAHVRGRFKSNKAQFIHGDFLAQDISSILPTPVIVAGNFPYNISSQIVFRILDQKEEIPFMIGMFQKEVAKRLCASPGKKDYGLISVLVQAFYECDYLFEIPPHSFNPPPKVMSAVMQMRRKEKLQLDCDEKKFKMLVKTAFNQRRKTLRNSLKSIAFQDGILAEAFFDQRPEQLSLNDFVQLTNRMKG